jgi:hypothetical protein
MTQAPAAITDSYPLETWSERELLLHLVGQVAGIEAELARLKLAWSAGGLKGLRKAAADG